MPNQLIKYNRIIIRYKKSHSGFEISYMFFKYLFLFFRYIWWVTNDNMHRRNFSPLILIPDITLKKLNMYFLFAGIFFCYFQCRFADIKSKHIEVISLF